MNKKILLMAVLCLIAAGNLMAANLLLNPGFETGTLGGFSQPQTVINNWTKVGGNGWYHADAGAVRDARAVKIWMTDSNLYQDFNSIAGEIYNVGVWAISLSGDNYGLHGMNGVVAVQWLDSAKTTILSADIVGYFYGGIFTPPSTNTGGDPRNTWKNITGMAAAPTGASYGRIYLTLVNASGEIGGSINWDDVSVEQNLYPASNPNPTNGSTVDASVPVTLSWTNPDPRHPPDVITCDVYFGTDPCMPGTNPKVVVKQPVSSYYVGTLSPSTDYYWRVDCYDPDDEGPEIKTEGMLWTFTTKNQAPTVDAGLKQTVWKAPSSVIVAMDATVTDDGFPNPPSALTYAWTVDSGPATPTFSPSSTVEDPNVTFTVAGVYILRLTADDSDLDANDTVKIRVYEQGDTGIVAYYKLDDATGSTAVDSTGNGHDGMVIVDGEPYGTPAWTTGQVNGALDLDGSGDYVYCNAGWADFTDEMSVSVWIKCIFDASFQSIVTKGDSSWRLFRDSVSGDSDNASFTLSGIGPVASGSTGPVGDNQWHHVVGTFDGITQCIYVDGILAASTVVPAGSLIETNAYGVCIGADAEHEGEHEFNGIIDEVRIYEIGLTADMVLDQYIADGGPVSCGLNYLPGDFNEDCYVTFADFAEFAEDWLGCTDVTNERCNQ